MPDRLGVVETVVVVKEVRPRTARTGRVQEHISAPTVKLCDGTEYACTCHIYRHNYDRPGQDTGELDGEEICELRSVARTPLLDACGVPIEETGWHYDNGLWILPPLVGGASQPWSFDKALQQLEPGRYWVAEVKEKTGCPRLRRAMSCASMALAPWRWAPGCLTAGSSARATGAGSPTSALLRSPGCRPSPSGRPGCFSRRADMPRRPAPPVDLPVLAGWLSLPEAAVELGVSPQRVHGMIREGKIISAHAVGRKPVIIVLEDEIIQLAVHGREARQREGGPIAGAALSHAT